MRRSELNPLAGDCCISFYESDRLVATEALQRIVKTFDFSKIPY